MTHLDFLDPESIPPACGRCGTVADLSPDHPCHICGGRVWVNVASSPMQPGHGHHFECLACDIWILTAYRQDPQQDPHMLGRRP